MLVSLLSVTNVAKANACMYNPMASCGGNMDNTAEVEAETAERNKSKETTRGSSAKQDAEVAANVAKAIKDFKDKGIKDLDEIHGWDLTSTEAEREAGRCYVKTWYGKKEVNCDKK